MSSEPIGLRRVNSGNQFLHDMPGDIGEAEISSGVAIGELLVIEPEQRQNRGVKVVDMNFICDRLKSVFVRRTMDIAALNTATGHPGSKAMVVEVSAVDLSGICARFR